MIEVAEVRLHLLRAEEVVGHRADAGEQLLGQLAYQHAVVGDALARGALGQRVERAECLGREHEQVVIASRNDVEGVAELGAGPRECSDRILGAIVVPGERDLCARRRGRDRHAPRRLTVSWLRVWDRAIDRAPPNTGSARLRTGDRLQARSGARRNYAMWRVGLFDLLHRRRRFVLAVIATALAFGLSLLMAGTLAHLHNETNRIVALFKADQFVVADGGTGPFTTTRLLPASVAAEISHAPGVQRADAFVNARETLKGKDVNILGIVPGGLGSPTVHAGLPINGPGEAVVDTTLGYHIGDQFRLGRHDYVVAGLTSKTTFYFGQPTVFLTVADVQKNFLEGQPYATAIAVRGDLKHAPAGTMIMTDAQVRQDLNRPQKSGTQTVAIFNTLLWLMAAGIVATMVYLTALERSRDIAVLKAMGTSNGTLFGGMAVQGLALALAACGVGALVSLALTPVMPFAVETPAGAYGKVLVIGIVVGLVAALVGLRRAVHVDPALAFGRQA